MRWASTISRQASTDLAVREAIAEARQAFGDLSADLVFCFLSPNHVASARDVVAQLGGHFPGAVVLGCSAQSCVGGAVEVEEGPSLSLTLANLPDVSLHAFEVSPTALAAAGADSTGWREIARVDPDARPAFVLLGDPFSGNAEAVIGGLEAGYPGAVQVGGLASGGRNPGESVLLLQDRVLGDGFIGLALTGDVEIDTVVAQGCRPIGQPMFITRSEQNVIFEVDGRPPMTVLNELAENASERELRLFQTSLFVGVQMNPDQVELGRGDFLVRNVIGGDRDSGAVAVGALVEDTQVVQFQLRDGETAAEDLELGLSHYADKNAPASGALLFSCVGRGRGMYGSENHDSAALQRILGDISVSGFFCNGEIGPVQGRTFLHGYTSAFGIFRPRA